MKVLVTGSNSFIGKNLIYHLKEIQNIEILTFNRSNTFKDIENEMKDIDLIFHLIGTSRPSDPEEFYNVNYEITKNLVDIINEKNPSAKLIFSSSIQAELDNDYGHSKIMAENYIRNNLKYYYIYRLHNIFGKWSRPNYCSVVANFCYNIANDLDITINNPDKYIEFVYIDDLCKEFIDILTSDLYEDNTDVHYISNRYKISIGQLAEKIRSFKNFPQSIYVQPNKDDFTNKLFATYLSFLPVEKCVYTPAGNNDTRGTFTELIKTNNNGQISISITQPRLVRGGHFHHTKIEKIMIIKGNAKITFTNLNDNKTFEFIVSDDKLEWIIVPVGYYHKIENLSNDEMIMLLWSNELFDKDNSDTFSITKKKGNVL